MTIQDQRSENMLQASNTGPTAIYLEPISQQEHQPLQSSTPTRLPGSLIIAGIVEGLLLLFIAVSMMPKVTNLNQEFDGSTNNLTLTYLILGASLLSSLVQIIYGYLLWRKQRLGKGICTQQKKIATVLLIVGTVTVSVFIPLLIMSIILPIYNLTSTL